jgi:hypothetical protein
LEGLAEQHLAFAVSDLAAARKQVFTHDDVTLLEEGVITEGYIVGQHFFDIAGPDGEDIEFVERQSIDINPRALHPDGGSALASS